MRHYKCEKTTRKRSLKWIKKICGTIFVFTFIFLLGTAGAVDNELLSQHEMFMRVGLSLVIMFIAHIGLIRSK